MATLWYVSGTDEIQKVWPFIKKDVQSAVTRSHGEYSMDLVAENLLEGPWDLFVGWEAEPNPQALGFIMASPEPANSENYRIYLQGGRRKARWMNDLDPIYTRARDLGCKDIRALVPPSAAKTLSDFTKARVELRMAL